MKTSVDGSYPLQAARSSNSQVPLSAQVTPADIKRTEEYDQDYEQRYRTLRNAQLQKFRAERDAARRRLHEAIGADHAYALRLRLHDLKALTRRRLTPPAGLDLDFEGVHRDRIGQAAAFLRDRGITEAAIKTALAGVHHTVKDHLIDARNITKVIADEEVPQTVKNHITPQSGFAIRHPPYDGWQQGRDGWSPGGFTWITHLETDPWTGLVANEIYLFDVDASDIDLGQYVADSQIVFWFVPPSHGLVEAWVEVQCGKAVHELSLSDEWGVSDSSTTQVNFIMMHVLHGNVTGPTFSETSRFNWNSDETESVRREWVFPGNVSFHHLFSDGPVDANQPVLVRVGTRSTDFSRTNDMAVRSTSTFRWFIRSVQVRTTG